MVWRLRCCGFISCGQTTPPRPSSRAPTVAGPSGRWAARRTPPSPRCPRSSPARTGYMSITARPPRLQPAQNDRHAVHRYRDRAMVPRRLILWPRQLEPVAAQQAVQDRLDLQLPEGHADALVRAAAEGCERVAVPLVLVA